MNEETHLNEKEIKALFKKTIKPLWNDINYKLGCLTIQNYAKQLLKQSKTESKEHDYFRGEGISRGISINEESIFFSLYWICNYLYTDNKPSLESYLSTKTSLYLAYAIAKNYKKELKEIITKEQAEKIINIDYCDLI